MTFNDINTSGCFLFTAFYYVFSSFSWAKYPKHCVALWFFKGFSSKLFCCFAFIGFNYGFIHSKILDLWSTLRTGRQSIDSKNWTVNAGNYSLVIPEWEDWRWDAVFYALGELLSLDQISNLWCNEQLQKSNQNVGADLTLKISLNYKIQSISGFLLHFSCYVLIL